MRKLRAQARAEQQAERAQRLAAVDEERRRFGDDVAWLLEAGSAAQKATIGLAKAPAWGNCVVAHSQSFSNGLLVQ
jgi:hypothetical protein